MARCAQVGSDATPSGYGNSQPELPGSSHRCFFGWAFDSIGVSSPYFFSSAILAMLSLGFGLDQYERPGLAVAPDAISDKSKA